MDNTIGSGVFRQAIKNVQSEAALQSVQDARELADEQTEENSRRAAEETARSDAGPGVGRKIDITT